MQQILAAYEAMGGAKTPSEMAKALLKVEALLTAAAAMDEAWPEHWRTNWQRAASYCVDWKHALLLTATLQVTPASFPVALHVCRSPLCITGLLHLLKCTSPPGSTRWAEIAVVDWRWMSCAAAWRIQVVMECVRKDLRCQVFDTTCASRSILLSLSLKPHCGMYRITMAGCVETAAGAPVPRPQRVLAAGVHADRIGGPLSAVFPRAGGPGGAAAHGAAGAHQKVHADPGPGPPGPPAPSIPRQRG